MAVLTLAQRLAEAESQYHLLMTGQLATVYVDQNGERVEYSRTNVARLQGYIDDLQRQLGTGTVAPPLRMWL